MATKAELFAATIYQKQPKIIFEIASSSMVILGIETSCDDTCAALVEITRGKFIIRKNITASQAQLHKKYGGIVPEIAARKHVETIIPILNEVVGRRSAAVNAIAVTSGPGLVTSLHVGVETAKALSCAWNIPLVKMNHIEGHLYASLLDKDASMRSFRFPAIALIVSGGHTELIAMKNHGAYKLLGRTRDDAAGEAFDKAAKMMGLSYPGGPEISKWAQKGNTSAYDIPRPMIREDGYEFSFSGMKNAIRLIIEDIGMGAIHRASVKKNLSASIEHAIVDVLVTKSLRAVEQYHPKTFILAGGVAANTELRQTLAAALPRTSRLLIPPLKYCMDNAAMIAAASYHHVQKKHFTRYDTLTADANWELV